jgi:hypothetical protein
MSVDSPDRGSSSRPIAKPKSLGSFGFQGHAFGLAALKASNGLRAERQMPPPTATQATAEDEMSQADRLWCDLYAPRQKVSRL